MVSDIGNGVNGNKSKLCHILVQLGVLRSVHAGGVLHCHWNVTFGLSVDAAFVKEIINSIAPEDGRISPKNVALK